MNNQLNQLLKDFSLRFNRSISALSSLEKALTTEKVALASLEGDIDKLVGNFSVDEYRFCEKITSLYRDHPKKHSFIDQNIKSSLEELWSKGTAKMENISGKFPQGLNPGCLCEIMHLYLILEAGIDGLTTNYKHFADNKDKINEKEELTQTTLIRILGRVFERLNSKKGADLTVSKL